VIAAVKKDVPCAARRAMMCTASCWICQKSAVLNVCVWVLLGEDWTVSHIGRLNNLTWWIAGSGKDTAKAFQTDIYGSALLHGV